MTNIIKFNGLTKLDIEPDNVLESAIGKLNRVLIIGTEENDNDYIASSTSNKKELLMMIETVKFKLMRGDFG